MKKIILFASLLALPVSAAFALTRTQQDDLHVEQVSVACLDMVTNKMVKHTGPRKSIYQNSDTGFTLVKYKDRAYTYPSHMCQFSATLKKA